MKTYIITILFLFSIVFTNAQCTDTGNYWNDSWDSCEKTANPNSIRGNSHWILYDFQQSYFIDSSYVWNANRVGESSRGAKEVIIDYSEDGITWLELGSFVFPKATEAVDYEGFVGPNFGARPIQKILMTVLNTYDDSGCASLSEIKFDIEEEGFATGIEELNNEKMTIYPNPVSDVLHVNLENINEQNIRLQITDVYGKLVKEKHIDNVRSTHRINTRRLPAGIYFANLSTNKDIISVKFIKH